MSDDQSIPWAEIARAARQHAAHLTVEDVGTLLPPEVRAAWMSDHGGAVTIIVSSERVDLQRDSTRAVLQRMTPAQITQLLDGLIGVPQRVPTRQMPAWEAAGPFGTVDILDEAVAVGGPLIILNRATPPTTGATLVDRGVLPAEAWRLLEGVVRGGGGVLVVAPLDCNRMGLFSALLAALPTGARVAVVEEQAQLRAALPAPLHYASLLPHLAPEIPTGPPMSALITEALRLHPDLDYLVVDDLGSPDAGGPGNEAAWAALHGAQTTGCALLATLTGRDCDMAFFRLAYLARDVASRPTPAAVLAAFSAAIAVVVEIAPIVRFANEESRTVVTRIDEVTSGEADARLEVVTSWARPLYALNRDASAWGAQGRLPLVQVGRPTSRLEGLCARG